MNYFYHEETEALSIVRTDGQKVYTLPIVKTGKVKMVGLNKTVRSILSSVVNLAVIPNGLDRLDSFGTYKLFTNDNIDWLWFNVAALHNYFDALDYKANNDLAFQIMDNIASIEV